MAFSYQRESGLLVYKNRQRFDGSFLHFHDEISDEHHINL